MDKKELYKRVLAELRDLGSGESLSVVGLAEEMGEPDSVIADVLEILHRHNYAWCSGRGCYSPSPKCRKATTDEIMSELGGCTTEKPRPEPEPVKEDHATQELRPSADRVCRFCGKDMEPNKVRRHENLCGKNPDSVSNTARRKATRDEAVVTNATATIEHEVDLDNDDLIATIEQIADDSPVDVPDEVQVEDDARTEQLLAKALSGDALVLRGSPGMDAALRLISYCQRMAVSKAQLSIDATVKVSEGFHIHVDLCVPAGESDE